MFLRAIPIATLAFMMAACGTSSAKEPPLPESGLSWWDLVNKVGSQIPLTAEKIRGASGIELSAEDSITWMNGPSKLADDVNIIRGELRTGDNGWSKYSYYAIDLGGRCISLDEVKAHFPDVHVTAGPTGHSRDEKTVYTSVQSWGITHLGFREKNPNCMTDITIRSEPIR
ncbi:hypothetical protein DSM43276_01685 [Mycobacteroides salmoniphilum]|nr:hypothetical protein DSM43276_01685 [Mycobacteroides salmoniphilum]